MAVRKQRATTSTLYAMEKEYKDVYINHSA